MVVGDLLCALNLASSAMVNGVCCFYQMHEEEERRKEHEAAVQRAVRNELQIHRHQEMLQRRHEKQVGSVVSRYQEERRRKLMTQKAESAQATPVVRQTDNDHQLWSRGESGPDRRQGHDQKGGNLRDPGITYGNETGVSDCNSISSTFAKSSLFDPKGGLPSRATSRIFVTKRDDWMGTRGSLLGMQQGSELSSLFDDLDDDDFQEIVIE